MLCLGAPTLETNSVENLEGPNKFCQSSASGPLEKRNSCQKSVTKLKLKDDTYTYDQSDILREEKQFYESLYTSKKVVPKSSRIRLSLLCEQLVSPTPNERKTTATFSSPEPPFLLVTWSAKRKALVAAITGCRKRGISSCFRLAQSFLEKEMFLPIGT